MDYVLSFKVNDAIYLRDPESSEIGKQMVKSAIDLIAKIGLEHFTFKKLAVQKPRFTAILKTSIRCSYILLTGIGTILPL